MNENQPEQRENTSSAKSGVVIVGELPRQNAGADSLRAQFNDPLTAAFIFSLFAGLISEVFGSWILAGLSMLSYFFYGLFFRPSARNTERFADSLYYLGFILTLFALFVAMSPNLFGGDELTSESIIQKFGIAIVTTFLGMTLRIILIQLRPAASDYEDEIRESITAYAQLINAEAKTTVAALTAFNSDIVHSTTMAARAFQDAVDSNSAASAATVEKSNDELVRSVQSVASRIEESVAELISRLSQVSVPTDVLSASIIGARDRLDRDFGALRNDVETGISGIVNALNESAQKLSLVKNDVSTLQKLISKTNSTVAKASDIAERNLFDAQQKLELSDQTVAGMGRLGEAASFLAKHLSDLSFALDNKFESVSKNLEIQSEAVEGIKRDSQLFSDTLLDSARELRNAIRDAARPE